MHRNINFHFLFYFVFGSEMDDIFLKFIAIIIILSSFDFDTTIDQSYRLAICNCFVKTYVVTHEDIRS